MSHLINVLEAKFVEARKKVDAAIEKAAPIVQSAQNAVKPVAGSGGTVGNVAVLTEEGLSVFGIVLAEVRAFLDHIPVNVPAPADPLPPAA